MRFSFGRAVPAIVATGRFLCRNAAPGPRKRCAVTGASSLLVLPAALAFVLSACAVQGDFGRPEPPTFMERLVHFPASERLSFPRSRKGEPALTADEVEMRETAYRLRTEIHNFKPVGHKRYSDENYANHLTRQGDGYGPARMARIDHELHADHQALTLFDQAARRVLAADMERIKAMHEEAPYLTAGDTRQGRSRIRDNYAFVEETFVDIRERIVAYEYAIDRTRIETPGVSTAGVMSSLNHLRDRAASLQYELYQTLALAGQKTGLDRRASRRAMPGAPRVLNPRHEGRPKAEPHPYK